MKKKTVLRGIIAALVTFFCAFALLVACTLPALYSLTGEAGVRKALTRVDYKARVLNDIKDGFAALSRTTGLGEEVTNAFLEEVLTQDVIEKPVFAILGGEAGSPDRAAMIEDLSARILTYAEGLRASGDLVMTPEQWQETKDDFPSVAGYYIDKVMGAVYLNGIYGVMGTALSFVARVRPYLAGFAAIVLVGSVLLLLALQKKRIFPYLYAAFTSAGLLSTTCSALFLSGEWGMRIGLEPAYLKLFLNEILCDFARCVLICGCIMIAVGIAFLIVGIFSGKKRAPHNAPEHQEEGQTA